MSLLSIINQKASHVTTIKELEERLALDRPLRVKYGIDPTSPHIHLGHTVPLRLLRQFQDAGHKAIIILGDYTASLGDPSGRDSMRVGVDLLTARQNCNYYLAQLKKLICMDFGKCEVHYNSGWLQNMLTRDWMDRLKHWTVQQVTERDDFKKRMHSGVGVHLVELLYPLMQGEDSVRIQADVELGGQEQLFTLQMAREMQKLDGQSPQVCICLPILRGLDGVRRMGKSLNNYIGIDEDPFEQYSKVMSIPDDLMPEWFNLLTDESCQRLVDEMGPMEAKKSLAHLIVGQFCGPVKALEVEKQWVNQFTLRKQPDVMDEVSLDATATVLANVIVGIATSKSNARRLIEQGAVQVNGTKFTDPRGTITPEDGMVIKCGRHYIRVKVKT